MRLAVVQHTLRATEKLDLAALLTLTHEAAEQGAQAVVCPCVPGLAKVSPHFQEFASSMPEAAGGAFFVSPCAAAGRQAPKAAETPLGRTLVLVGDECIDDELFPLIEAEQPQALVWQLEAESRLQAEALLEFALQASISLAGLVVVASASGKERHSESHGGSAIVQAGDIRAEAGEGEEILMADIEVPVEIPGRASWPTAPPILAQRLASHRGRKVAPPYPADLS